MKLAIGIQGILLWIEYYASAFIAWCCEYKLGTRKVGVCAHFVSILWCIRQAGQNTDTKFVSENWCAYLKECQRYATDESRRC